MNDEYVTISTSSHLHAKQCDVIAIGWRGEEDEKEASRLAIAEALKWSALQKKILWDLDLAFSQLNVMEDEILFHSRRVLIEYFGETCLSQSEISTFGVCLYTGSVDFENHLVWSENIEEHYFELIEERRLEMSRYQELWKRGYALEILAEYLHKLGSYLHDDIPLFCSLDASSLKSPAEVMYLLSKERFQHLNIILKGCALPIPHYCREYGFGSLGGWDLEKQRGARQSPKIGLVNPVLDIWTDQTVVDCNAVVSQLENKLIEYRIVNESTLTEEWDGIEILIMIGNSLTSSGKRKLQGYLASGGEILIFGDDQKFEGLGGTNFGEWIQDFKKRSE